MNVIDLYCERLGEGYFAEPVNVFSNLAFFIAAFYAWKETEKYSIRDLNFQLLIALMVAIGLGSMSFHVFANSTSQLADLLAIFMFQIIYLWLYAKMVWGCKRWLRIVLVMLLLGSILIASGFEDRLNGSVLYLPTLAVLIIIGLYHLVHSQPEASLAISALVLFSLALVFRTVDRDVCEYLSSGSHFMWHVLNAMVVYLMFIVVLINRVRNNDKIKND